MQIFKKIGLVWGLCSLLILINSFYWTVLATDRFVSEANVVLESPEITATNFNMAAMLSNSKASNDLMLLRDHMLSVDMMKKIDAEVNLREHYASKKIDFFSRMREQNDPMEKFHEYYLNHIQVDVDDYAGVLRLKVAAFSPEMANNIAKKMLEFGEIHMNKMGQRLALEQVRFIENQVVQLADRLTITRENLIRYQNEHGLISPTGTVESITAVIAGLENELAQLAAKRNALRNFQSKHSPDITRLNGQIGAIEQQISIERGRMATESGNALNAISAEYEALELQSKFALDLYSNALGALENTRVEAVRKLKQISVLQEPTFPEYSIEPARLSNILIFSICMLLVGVITQMIFLVIKDHRD